MTAWLALGACFGFSAGTIFGAAWATRRIRVVIRDEDEDVRAAEYAEWVRAGRGGT